MRRRAPLPRPKAICLLFTLASGLAGGLFGISPARAGPTEVRGLFRKAELLVVRGRVLDGSSAPGGRWHRFQVEEVIWAAPAAPGTEPVSPLLRLFAHGEGMCRGADLGASAEWIVGLSPLPPADSPGLHPFLKRLAESFVPDLPGERPLLVSPDGAVALDEDPSLAQAVGRMVRVLRDPAAGPARVGFLLSLAADGRPALREEALRHLARHSLAAERSGERAGEQNGEAASRALFLLDDELSGPAHPRVLEAHLDLLESARPPGAGPVLSRLLRAAPREDLALRAAEALAALGEPQDLGALAAGFESAAPAVQVRTLRALSRAGSAEHGPLFEAALSSPHAGVRLSAVEELSGHAAPFATALLEQAGAGADLPVRRAARAALERAGARTGEIRTQETRESTKSAPPAGDRLQKSLEAARRRLGGDSANPGAGRREERS